MIKKNYKIVILISLIFLLTGCWDYIGLDEITVVMGVSIDKNKENNKYELAFEYVDLTESSKNKGIATKIIESSGSTIFDAIRNAKRRVRNKLYFSQAQSIIVSKEIAEKEGLKEIINFFLRDGELRETIKLIISDEKKAKDILKAKSIDNPSIGHEIQEIVDNDNIVVSSTMDMMLFKLYDTLLNDAESISTPAFHLTKNDGKEVIEANGIIVYKKDKAIGKLNSFESKFYLFTDNEIKGGVLPLKYKSNNNNITLEITQNNTTSSYTHKGDKFKFTIKTNTMVYLGEYESQPHNLTEKELSNIEKEAGKMIEKNIKKLIDKAKKEYKHDIFSLSNLIANKDAKLWSKVKKKWDKLFLKADIKVESKVIIENTEMLK
jgi:spore germination protein KC